MASGKAPSSMLRILFRASLPWRSFSEAPGAGRDVAKSIAEQAKSGLDFFL
jgi:hypothetical protein